MSDKHIITPAVVTFGKSNTKHLIDLVEISEMSGMTVDKIIGDIT